MARAGAAPATHATGTTIGAGALPPPPPPAAVRANPCICPPVLLLCRLGQVLGRPIDHPSAWTGEDMRQRQREWIYQLTSSDLAELEEATDAAAATGKAVEVGSREGAWPPQPGQRSRAAGSRICRQGALRAAAAAWVNARRSR